MTDKRNDCNFSNNIMTNENNYYNLDKITDEKRASALRKKTDVLTAKIRSGKLLVPVWGSMCKNVTSFKIILRLIT